MQHLNNTVHETMFQASFLARSTGKKGGLEKQHLRIVRGMMSGTTRPARHTPRHLVLLCPQLGALVLQRHITPHGCNEAAESMRVLWLAPASAAHDNTCPPAGTTFVRTLSSRGMTPHSQLPTESDTMSTVSL